MKITRTTTLAALQSLIEKRGAWLERVEKVGRDAWRVEFVQEPHYVAAFGNSLAGAIAEAVLMVDREQAREREVCSKQLREMEAARARKVGL